jgi:hypothetical protein
VVNGSVTKPATDDPGMLAQRLSIVEARLGVVEAALQLNTSEPDAQESPVRNPRYLGWLTAIAALIAVLGNVLVRAAGQPGTRAAARCCDRDRTLLCPPRAAGAAPLRVVTIAVDAPADAEAVYHWLIETLPPSERAELARLLADDGAQWAHYYPEVPAAVSA